MITFLEFLEVVRTPERALKFGRQLTKKYGTRIESPEGNMDLHLPLPKKDDDFVEEAWDKYFDVMFAYRKLHNIKRTEPGTPFSDIIPTLTNVKDLIPGQDHVNYENPDISMSKITNPSQINIIIYKGKKIIVDGHHSLVAHVLSGKKQVLAKQLNLDAY